MLLTWPGANDPFPVLPLSLQVPASPFLLSFPPVALQTDERWPCWGLSRFVTSSWCSWGYSLPHLSGKGPCRFLDQSIQPTDSPLQRLVLFNTHCGLTASGWVCLHKCFTLKTFLCHVCMAFSATGSGLGSQPCRRCLGTSCRHLLRQDTINWYHFYIFFDGVTHYYIQFLGF